MRWRVMSNEEDTGIRGQRQRAVLSLNAMGYEEKHPDLTGFVLDRIARPCEHRPSRRWPLALLALLVPLATPLPIAPLA